MLFIEPLEDDDDEQEAPLGDVDEEEGTSILHPTKGEKMRRDAFEREGRKEEGGQGAVLLLLSEEEGK